MYLKLSLVVITICIILTKSSFSQTTASLFDKKNSEPTSPEAAMMERFGDIPIGYYTGTADISIPLYSVKEGNIEIPITLRYHGSGIKVADESGWAGLGWSLEPEGTIIQSVVGKEDILDLTTSDYGYTFLKSRALQGNYSEVTEIGCKTWNCNNGSGCAPDGTTICTTGDERVVVEDVASGGGQPDIYYYNFGGYSGKFYINPETHLIVEIDKKSQIKFENGDNKWTARTLDGNKFYFNALEITAGGTIGNAGYTWKLTSITSNNNKTIDFSYIDGSYFGDGPRGVTWHDGFQYNLDQYGSVGSGLITSAPTTHNVKTLSKISTSDVIVDFNLETRDDINISTTYNVKRLKSIDITSAISNIKIKTINFGYSYFPYSTIGGHYGAAAYSPDGIPIPNIDVRGKRLKLDYVQEVGYNPDGSTVLKPSYQFGYDTRVTLPLKTSYAIDFYGYFNGKDNNYLLPDLSYFYYSGNGNEHSVTLRPSVIPNYAAGDRIPDTSKMSAGMLNKITYPTGGSTEFDYEPNSFTNYSLPDQAKIKGSYRDLSIADANISGSITSKQFTISKTSIVRFTNTIFNGYPVQTPAPLSYNDMLGSKITLMKVSFPGGAGTSPSFTILKTWDMSATSNVNFTNNHGQKWYEDVTILYDGSPLTYFIVTTTMTDAIGAQNSSTKIALVSSRFSFYDETGLDMSTSYQCGLRIAAVRSYSSAGNIVSNKSIKYINSDGSTSGKLMAPVVFMYEKPMWFGKYEPTGLCEGFYCSDNQHNRFASSESFTGSNSVGYSRVEEIELASDNSNNGKHIYNYINNESQWMINAPTSPYLKNGLLSSEQLLTSTAKLLKENTYYYQNILSGTRFMGVKIFSSWVGMDQCNVYPASLSDGRLSTAPEHKYRISYYPINSEWNKLQQKVTTEYDANNTMLTTTNTENYTYNSYGQLISSSFLNSKNQTVSNTFLYPIDSYSTSSSLLQGEGLFDKLLESRKLINSAEVFRADFDYGYLGTQTAFCVVNTKISKSNNQQELYSDVTLDLYGSNKNLLQFTEHGLTSSFIWSDNNSYIIAEATKGNYINTAYTSFEKNETGQWTFTGISQLNPTSPTGKNVYQVSNGLSKANLTSSMTYIVSYWSNSSAAYAITGTKLPVKTGPTINGWTFYEHTITGVLTVSITGTGFIDEVKLYPIGSQMTTYTYAPLKGISTRGDVNNRITYYEYDGFNRLKLIRDQYNNILKRYCYNYYNQVEDCGATIGNCVNCTGEGQKCILGECESGVRVYTSSVDNLGHFICTYHYEFSDGSWSYNYTSSSSAPCLGGF